MLVNGSMVQSAYPYTIGSIFPGQIRPWNPKADLTVHLLRIITVEQSLDKLGDI